MCWVKLKKTKRIEIGRRLLWVRKEKGLTQKQMAEDLHVSLVSYRRAEQGSQEVSVHLLEKISRASGLKIDLFEEHLRSEDEAALQYWIRTMNTVQGYMKAHKCTAEKALSEMCFSEQDQMIILKMIRSDQAYDA